MPATIVESTIESACRDFKENGYLLIRGFFSSRQTKGMLENVQRYIREVVPTLDETVVFHADKDKPETLFRTEALDQHDDWFDRLNHDDRITTLAKRLLDDELYYQRVAFFGKLPNGGEATPPHQDGYYFRLTPNEAMTVWLPLDPVDQENGCIRYVPGSHLNGLREHNIGKTYGFSLGIDDYGPADEEAEVAIEANPGDLILHHSLTIHRADSNNSNRQRRALGLVYFAARAQPDDEAAQAHEATIRKQWKKDGCQ